MLKSVVITDKVTRLFPVDLLARIEPPATQKELEEYRAMLPRLVRMLDEWEAVTSCNGCPVARHVLIR